MSAVNTLARRRCFIGFFGITRALEWTIESIERNVFAPLRKSGMEQVRAAHFNQPKFLNAPRSNETNLPFEMGDINRLGLHELVIEAQSDENIAAYCPYVMAVPQKDEVDQDGATRRNALHQLYSLKGLSRLFASMNPHSFDIVLLLRPDLRYLDPLPLRQLLAQLTISDNTSRGLIGQTLRPIHTRFQPPADLVLPAWHKWGGLNDRFAICTPIAAKVYMNRIESVAEFCVTRQYFQTEHLLDFTIAQAGLRTADTWVRAERVRSGGSIEPRDSFRRRDRLRWFIGR